MGHLQPSLCYIIKPIFLAVHLCLICLPFGRTACLICLPFGRTADLDSMINCLEKAGVRNFTTGESTSFSELLDFSLQNLRFTEASVREPAALIFPQSAEDVQKAFICSSVSNGWEVRVRSGGHSYEGLSSTADGPFVIIDFSNMDSVEVDMDSKTAWVEAGATLGQIYYHISEKTSTYAFSAGICSTMGSGGHFSGGGYGMLSRKYGVAADNVIDAQIIDASGNLLDRRSMGEDLFWALRGGGGGSWGIVVAWKIKLVPVPQTITVFNLQRTGRQQVNELVYKWQSFAPSAPQELFMAVYIAGNNQSGKVDTGATFYGQYLAPLNQTLTVITKTYPELALRATDCKEVAWIEAVAEMDYKSITDLPDRFNHNKNYFKAKSDYVTTPITAQALQGALQFLEENPKGYIILEPYRGVMDQIPSNAIAFPHRAGNLYVIQYQVVWSQAGGPGEDNSYIDWIRRFYSYMTPYVSTNPRAAYVNYVDLDLGSVANGTPSFEEARSWGEKYFRGNFERLVEIKRRVDPNNLFRNPQTL